MSEKKKKTLYLPDWVVDFLDAEGERYDGPGVVAAAAINAFCTATDAQKSSILQGFRQAEIEHVYPSKPTVDEVVRITQDIARARKARPAKRTRGKTT